MINRGLLAVLAAAFLNLLGFTMTIPITPALKRHFYIADGTMGGTARAGRLREALEADELVAPYIDGQGADATELADLMGCVGDDAVSWPTYVCGWLCAAGCVRLAVCGWLCVASCVCGHCVRHR